MDRNTNTKIGEFREKVFRIIFLTNTPVGKGFDVVLLIMILASVAAVMLETVVSIEAKLGKFLIVLEWIFTIFFTIEYVLRLFSARNARKYAFSFFGIVDLLAILPTYVSILFPASHYLMVVRALRLLRIFRIFKLTKFLNQSEVIVSALKASREKITVFLVFVVLLVTLVGSLMYLIEGGSHSGFTSIPKSIYWAIVTLTTVGFGDIHPVTPIGQFLAAIIMIMGYSVIAVPTGIVGAEIARTEKKMQKECTECGKSEHGSMAAFCDNCGTSLPKPE